MACGDKVEIFVDCGGTVTSGVFRVEATKKGRSVEVKRAGTMVEVSEVTSRGNPVHTDRFMASRVIALTEHKTEESAPSHA